MQSMKMRFKLLLLLSLKIVSHSIKTLCEEPRIDASVATTRDFIYYVFRDSNYWEVDYKTKQVSEMRHISRDWKGLTVPIRASFSFFRKNTSKTNGIYFFITEKELSCFQESGKVRTEIIKEEHQLEDIPNNVWAALELPPYEYGNNQRNDDIMLITPTDFFIFSPGGDLSTYPYLKIITQNYATVRGQELSFLNTSNIENKDHVLDRLDKNFYITASLTLHIKSQPFKTAIIFNDTKHCEIAIPSELMCELKSNKELFNCSTISPETQAIDSNANKNNNIIIIAIVGVMLFVVIIAICCLIWWCCKSLSKERSHKISKTKTKKKTQKTQTHRHQDKDEDKEEDKDEDQKVETESKPTKPIRINALVTEQKDPELDEKLKKALAD